MADCKEIDAALAGLSGKIDGLNGRLNGLEARQKECCDNKQQNQNTDLSALIKRIAKLEKDLQVIIDFIVAVRPILNTLSTFRLFNFGGE